MTRALELADKSAQHLGAIGVILRSFEHSEIALYQHHFIVEPFGFTVILGHETRRLRFIWRGSDQTLEFSIGKFANSRSPGQWRLYGSTPFDTIEAAYEEIRAKTREVFAI